MKKTFGILLLISVPILFYNSYKLANTRLGQSVMKENNRMFYRIYYPFSYKDIQFGYWDQFLFNGSSQKKDFFETFSEAEKSNAQLEIIGFCVCGVLGLIFGLYLINRSNYENGLTFEIFSKSKIYSLTDPFINVYSKIDQSSEPICNLKTGDQFKIDNTTEWGIFYKVIISTGQKGYILKKSNFIEVNKKNNN